MQDLLRLFLSLSLLELARSCGTAHVGIIVCNYLKTRAQRRVCPPYGHPDEDDEQDLYPTKQNAKGKARAVENGYSEGEGEPMFNISEIGRAHV